MSLVASRRRSCLVVLSLALFCPVETAADTPFLRGDSNGDGSVDLADAVFTLEWLFPRNASPGCIAATDVNADNAVNISDPVYLLFYAFGSGPVPAEPFPECGPGTEADQELGCETLSTRCSAPPTFMLGADISVVQEQVDSGAIFIDTDGVTKSMLALLKAHGFNTIRLRTFVDPGALYGYARGTGGGCQKAENYCDKAHTIEVGQAVRAAGMRLLLDFHYSDTWADPGKQIIPESWRDSASIAELATHVKDYTVDVITGLIDAGARPHMVQIGNEISPGMLIHVPTEDTDCWGNGSAVHSLNGRNSDWDNLAELLKAGIDGVREVDESIRIMLHLASTENLGATRWWIENALSNGVEFDVLGLSCYTAWHGDPTVWRDTFETLAAEFPELSFVVAEYNPERTEVQRIMRDLPDSRGLGTFFWEPTRSGTWGSSMFTITGNTYRAKLADFAEFDAIREELGL